MEPSDLRGRLRTLADDFGWLESHCRAHPDQQVHTTYLRLAAALTRNVMGPAAEKQPAVPLHVAVVGGAGAGKSTVVNFLMGTVLAEANPQAGYTRHPTAFVPEAHLNRWPNSDGFLGPLRKVEGTAAANRDEDVYQRVASKLPVDDPISEFTVWDCPDMTTVAAEGYTSRLTEVAALADVIVYVASDERYNDAVPTEYLHLLIRAGKAVVVCLTKVSDANAAGLTQHFRDEVLGKLPPLADGSKPNVPVVCIPQIAPDVRNDPRGLGKSHRVTLVNQILALCPSVEAARLRTITNALRFLETASEGLLDVARSDIRQMDAWKKAVTTGREQFEDRYRREFLAGESIRRFDQSQQDVVALFELPSKAQAVSTIIGFARWPFEKVRDFLMSLVRRPAGLAMPERDVLNAAFTAWLDGLRAEAIRQSASHPLWKQAAGALANSQKETLDRFTLAQRDFETVETIEIETEVKALAERFTGSPMLVNILRGVKIVAELAAVGLTIYFLWASNWIVLLIAIPFVLFLVHQLFELMVKLLVETARAKVRGHRMAIVAKHLSTPLEQTIAAMPVIEGSAVERINQLLSRVPTLITQVAQSMRSGAAA